MTATPCWQDAEPRIRLETLIETSTLFSGPLDDRSGIRARQDEALIRELMAHTATTAQTRAQAERFYFGSLDFLVSAEEGDWRFWPIELNGSAVIGLSNLPFLGLNAVSEELQAYAKSHHTDSPPLFLTPFSSGGISNTPAKALHERLIYAQAIKTGYHQRWGRAKIVSTKELLSQGGWQDRSTPTVVLGLIHEILPNLSVQDGRLTLMGRPVSATTHDLFCDVLTQKYAKLFSAERSYACINEIFPFSSNKTLFCEAYNRYRAAHAAVSMTDSLWSRSADNESDLCQHILEGLAHGRRLVIKPRASALGRGIEFFLQAEESPESIGSRVQEAIHSCLNVYGPEETCFPYSVCEFIDATTIEAQGSRFYGHKFELRMYMFRRGEAFFAIPGIVKVSSQAYDPEHLQKTMLLNNIAVALQHKTASSSDFILPLANDETLSILGLERRHLFEICQFATRFVDFLTQERPSA